MKTDIFYDYEKEEIEEDTGLSVEEALKKAEEVLKAHHCPQNIIDFLLKDHYVVSSLCLDEYSQDILEKLGSDTNEAYQTAIVLTTD